MIAAFDCNGTLQQGGRKIHNRRYRITQGGMVAQAIQFVLNNLSLAKIGYEEWINKIYGLLSSNRNLRY